jgi:ferredoxin
MLEGRKRQIKDFALELGADDVGFAAVAGYASPLTPDLHSIFPEVKTLIVMAFQEASHCESDNMRIAMGGRLAIMEFMKACDYKLTHFLECDCQARAMSTPMSYPLNIAPEAKFGLIGDISHRHAAIAAGLGTWGRNNLVIHPQFGARVLFSTILTDLELPPDPPVTEVACNDCNICVTQCPADALEEKGKTEQMKCLAHSQPYGIGSTIGFWTRFIESSVEEQKKLLRSPEFMRLNHATSLTLQYYCFKCYASCPSGRLAKVGTYVQWEDKPVRYDGSFPEDIPTRHEHP